jgi:hypothetical protein
VGRACGRIGENINAYSVLLDTLRATWCKKER